MGWPAEAAEPDGEGDVDGDGDGPFANASELGDGLGDAVACLSVDSGPARASADGDGEGDAEGDGLAAGLGLLTAPLEVVFFPPGGLLACAEAGAWEVSGAGDPVSARTGAVAFVISNESCQARPNRLPQVSVAPGRTMMVYRVSGTSGAPLSGSV